MNNRVFTAIGLILFLTLSSNTILAATTTVTKYDVELVVFKHTRTDLDGDEIWSPERVNHSLTGLDKASKAADTTNTETSIGKAVLAISEHADYEILAHKRWTQTAEAKSTSPLMRVVSEQAELDGTIVFYMSRFLHIELQMLLQDADQSSKLGEAIDQDSSGELVSEAGTNTLAYRIEESRRIRSKEIHYFDHPKFGILVQVTPKQ